jgi:hypothetical protein
MVERKDISLWYRNFKYARMKAIKEKPLKKGQTVKIDKKNLTVSGQKLSAIAKFWATIDSSDGEILDMKAVLR